MPFPLIAFLAVVAVIVVLAFKNRARIAAEAVREAAQGDAAAAKVKATVDAIDGTVAAVKDVVTK